MDARALTRTALLVVTWSYTVQAMTFTYFGGSCYSDVAAASTQNYNKGQKLCEDLGSKVVEIETEAEMEFVRQLIDDYGQPVWVGLERGNNKVFTWPSSGNEALANWWFDGEPDNSGTCVSLTKKQQDSNTEVYVFTDNPCGRSYSVLCEKAADVTPSGSGDKTFTMTAVTASDKLCQIGATATSRSRTHCAVKCAHIDSCVAFLYDAATKDCSLFSNGSDSCTNLLTSSTLVHHVAQGC